MKLNVVRAASGAHWMLMGMRTFWRQPIALGGLFLLFIIFTSVFAFIPYIGNLLAIAFIPALSLGLMNAAKQAHEGRFPMPSSLLVAFSGQAVHRKTMLQLGLAYAFFFLAILGISALMDDGQFASLYLLGGAISPEMLQSSSFEAAIWTAILCYLPFSALFWHAPALVHWHGVPLAKSLFFSLMACLTNWRAFLVYVLCWTAFMVGVIMAALLLLGFLDLSDSAGLFLAPLMVLLATQFFISSYFSYVACLEENTPAP